MYFCFSSGDSITWGRVTSEYLGELWSCMWLTLDHLPAGQQVPDHCLQTMDLVAGLALIPVFRASKALIPGVSEIEI